MDFSGQKYGNVVPCFSPLEKVAHFRSLRGEKAHHSLCTDFYRLLLSLPLWSYLLSLPLWSYLVSLPCNKLWWWVQPYAESCVFLAKNRTCGQSWGSLKQALEYTYAHSETKSSINHFTHIQGPSTSAQDTMYIHKVGDQMYLPWPKHPSSAGEEQQSLWAFKSLMNFCLISIQSTITTK